MKIIFRIAKSIEARSLSYINQILKKKRKKIEETIPKISFKKENICNTTILTDRAELLKMLPVNGIVAELGVDRGLFSDQILRLNQPKKLHLIDLWNSANYPENLMNEVKDKFSSEIERSLVEINRGLSIKVLQEFPDQYFDWVYLDTDHSYNTTKQELQTIANKIKKNGIIAGHDFIHCSYVSGVRYGVIEAVTEFCVQNNWELIFLTMDYSSYPSFGIRKINILT